ncbi:MAG: LapA family protein [Desulfobacteraceae bacterium]|nr:LapA family protein [Desulfobacteraceae bacterium]MBC2756684.1 LapA family protein [Desulfobacteraceae bacterium]
MRKVKLAFWLILLGLLGVVFWQNQTFFLEKRGVGIDYLIGNYHTPELQIALYFLIFFLVGLLISYFSSLSERFVARKTNRKLKDELTNVRKKISDLEASLASQQADRTFTSEAANVPELSAT